MLRYEVGIEGLEVEDHYSTKDEAFRAAQNIAVGQKAYPDYAVVTRLRT